MPEVEGAQRRHRRERVERRVVERRARQVELCEVRQRGESGEPVVGHPRAVQVEAAQACASTLAIGDLYEIAMPEYPVEPAAR